LLGSNAESYDKSENVELTVMDVKVVLFKGEKEMFNIFLSTGREFDY